MIDVDVMQGYIRDANPIPTLDDLDPDELTAFVTAARTRRAALMQAPTQHPTTPTTPVTPPPQRRRRAWAFAAAFILIVLAVGITALVTRNGDEAPVTDEPETPVTVPPTISAPAPIDVQSLTWSRVPHDETVFNPTGEDMMRDVVVGGPGFVAVGHIGGEVQEAAVWVSEDGITWSRLPFSDPSLRGWRMWSVTSSGLGLVAAGTELNDLNDETSVCKFPGVVACGTVWTSEDGTAWSKVMVESESSVLLDVTAGGPGLVAVGHVVEQGGWGGAVYTSADGITWNRVPQDPEMLDGIASVTAGGPGLVAFGSSDNDGPAVWTSPDGLAWTSLLPTELIGIEGPLRSVFAVDSQLVAVGSCVIGDDSPLVAVGTCVWTSADGVTWTHVHTSESGTINSVAATDFGLIAVGEDKGAAAVWIATEG